MKPFSLLRICASLSVLLALAACNTQPASPMTEPTAATTGETVATSETTSGDNAAVETVQNYLTAKVSNNDERLRTLLCAEKEADFEIEASSFDAVTEARIENMACTAQDNELVICTGRIVATYGTEDQDFELGAYRVVQEDGAWKWCGEAAVNEPLPGSTAEALGE